MSFSEAVHPTNTVWLPVYRKLCLWQTVFPRDVQGLLRTSFCVFCMCELHEFSVSVLVMVPTFDVFTTLSLRTPRVQCLCVGDGSHVRCVHHVVAENSIEFCVTTLLLRTPSAFCVSTVSVRTYFCTKCRGALL